MRNGYFQIGCTGGGTVVRLVKPVDGGNEVTAREIAEYLSGHGIVYDAGLLTKGIQTAASVANNEFLFLVIRISFRKSGRVMSSRSGRTR